MLSKNFNLGDDIQYDYYSGLGSATFDTNKNGNETPRPRETQALLLWHPYPCANLKVGL